MKVKQLEKTITKMAADFEGEAGINVQLLPGGEVIGVNDCQIFPLASVFKIPILVEFLSQCEEGHCDMTERIDLKSSSFTPGSGVLRFMDPGLQPTWKDLATLMIIVSDNTATDLVFERVGASQIDEKAKSLGMQNTSINADCANVIGIAAGYERQRIEKIGPQNLLEKLQKDNATMDPERLIQKNVDTSTASDVTDLLYQIESGSALSCQMRELALDILKSQRLSSRLPAKLSPNIEVAHKTGTIGSVVNDAGIIYVPATEKKFALTVFTKDCPDKAQAEAFIASVAAEIFEFIKDKY